MDLALYLRALDSVVLRLDTYTIIIHDSDLCTSDLVKMRTVCCMLGKPEAERYELFKPRYYQISWFSSVARGATVERTSARGLVVAA